MNFEEKRKIVAERKRRAEEIYREGSKLKLRNELEKRCRTIMIAALDEYEKGFGHIWGHKQEDEELTDDQLEAQQLWLDVREAILDRGNDQIKMALQEVDKCEVNYAKQEYHFITKMDERG